MNKLSPDDGTLSNLASDMQDCWHYCTLICPALCPGDQSTFVGDGYYSGLQGKLKAYEVLAGRVYQWSVPSLAAFCGIELLSVDRIETVEQLTAQATLAFNALTIVCNENRLDGRTGYTFEQLAKHEAELFPAITVSRLPRPEQHGDWHDKPLKWQVKGPGSELQKFSTRKEADRFASCRRKSTSYQEADDKFQGAHWIIIDRSTGARVLGSDRKPREFNSDLAAGEFLNEYLTPHEAYHVMKEVSL